ncbi:MAG: hypothetical protein ABSE18_00655 [Minisyncoccia bacterium]|jgi:hypothetical protein
MEPGTETGKSITLSLTFSPEGYRELQELQNVTGLPTRALLFRHALRWLQWTCEEVITKEGKILLQREGEEDPVEVVFPPWLNIDPQDLERLLVDEPPSPP